MLRTLEAGPGGLTSAEAAARLARFGANEIEEERGPTMWRLLLRQFQSPLIYILLAAAAVTLAIGEYADGIAIGVVLVLNAAIGFLQERRAERSMEALRRLAPAQATALRDGHEALVETRALVPGDVLLLEAGARVPTDARVLQAAALEADESLMSGESTPVAKQVEPVAPTAAVPDRRSMLFAGTVVTRGRARAVVVTTGGATELGELAAGLRALERVSTPLQQRMESFARVIGAVALGGGALGVLAGLIAGTDPRELLLILIALAVSAIPEGLAIVFTITLALGMQRMARRNVVVRRLAAVETLGSCTLIGSDKTGTLTENRMTVRWLWAAGRDYTVSGAGYDLSGELLADGATTAAQEETLRLALTAAALCNDATLPHPAPADSEGTDEHEKDGQPETFGDPTEVALLVLAAKGGLSRAELELELPRVAEIPFSPEERYHATVHQAPGGSHRIFVAGAPERVAEMCDSAAGLPALDRDALHALATHHAEQGLRIIGLAYDERAGEHDGNAAGAPGGLTFLGLVGMMDPPRPGVAEAVRGCQQAGLRVMMITGDHAATGMAVARELGIADAGDVAITGSELADLDDAELRRLLPSTPVFARISPDQKLRIVLAARELGEIVAVTGDGVNDAAALKAADLGAAMGRSGTDVAREAADMVITDDNFASIFAAVREGRIVFDNVRNATFYLISSGVAEVLAVLVAIAAAQPLPLLPAQLLWLNVVTNGVQGAALAVEPGEPDVDRRPPRPPSEHVISPLLWERTAIAGAWMATGTLLLFFAALELDRGEGYARSLALTTMVAFQLVHVGNARSERRSAFAKSPLANPFLLVGTATAGGLHIAALYLPGLSNLLRLEPLDAGGWAAVLAVALTIVPVMEAHKLLRGRRALAAPGPS